MDTIVRRQNLSRGCEGGLDMKKLFIVFVLSLFGINIALACNQTSEQNHEKSMDLVLCGQIKEIVIEKKAETIEHITAIIDFQLQNNSPNTKIIIPDRLQIIGGSGSLKNGNHFVNYSSYGSSTFKSYEKTQQTFNKPSPIIDGVQLLKPNGTWQFSGSLSLELDRSITNPQDSWTNINNNSPLYLNVKIKTVDSYFIRNGKPIKGISFWLEIQKRWKKYGYLWLDDITSEPILLDLGSAVVKTESSP